MKEGKCETWEYTQECEEISYGGCDFFPYPGTKFLAYLCGEQLNGIYPGATVITTNNAERKVTRHYIRKVE